jgi:hypothetical protein
VTDQGDKRSRNSCEGETVSLPAVLRDVRVRLARDDLYDALRPVPRHAQAALLSLEEDDDVGALHHLTIVIDGVRKAALRRRDLQVLIGATS